MQRNCNADGDYHARMTHARVAAKLGGPRLMCSGLAGAVHSRARKKCGVDMAVVSSPQVSLSAILMSAS